MVTLYLAYSPLVSPYLKCNASVTSAMMLKSPPKYKLLYNNKRGVSVAGRGLLLVLSSAIGGYSQLIIENRGNLKPPGWFALLFLCHIVTFVDTGTLRKALVGSAIYF